MPRTGDRLSLRAGIGLEERAPPSPVRPWASGEVRAAAAEAGSRAAAADPGSRATGRAKPSVSPARPEAARRNPPPGAIAAIERDATARAVMSRSERAPSAPAGRTTGPRAWADAEGDL